MTQPSTADFVLAPPLADYADRLLLGTGLDATEALLIASGQVDPPAELRHLAGPLQAGWSAEDQGQPA
jgi:hypothetical protein